MESLLPGEGGQPHPASQPLSVPTEIERELLSLFTPDLMRDLLSQVPGMSLFSVKGALLFAGQRGDLYIMHTRERGPYFVDLETLRTAFNQVATDSGMLPPGVIRWGNGINGERWMAVYIPPARYTLNLVKIEPTLVRIDVPLPGFVFAGASSRYYLWAVKEPLMREGTVMYNAPLPNVSSGFGGVCWGSVSMPKVGNDTIHQAFRLFAESLFNGHMAAGSSHKYPDDVRSLLLELAQSRQRVYPFEDLVPMTATGGSVYTLRDALTSFIIPR